MVWGAGPGDGSGTEVLDRPGIGRNDQEAGAMKVLVAYASKHGSTAEIAQRLGGWLGAALTSTDVTAEVDVLSAEDVRDRELDGYGAVVIGSGVYAGHWLEPATELVEKHGGFLSSVPVWVFSSGPVGDLPGPHEEPAEVQGVLVSIAPRDHRLFGGALEKHRLGWGERAMVAALRAPEGDFRDWDAIEAWAGEIAAALSSPPAPAG
jgi:menaquinone-dependent protoporphyrinogen oxidase